MALAINITASYYHHRGIPPRCRKEQPTYFTIRNAFTLTQAPADSFTLAATVRSSQYFTSDAVEGFYTPVADAADVERLDLSTGGIFTDTKGTLDLSADATAKLAESLFGLNLASSREVKIADLILSKQVKDTWDDRLFTLPEKAAIDQQAGGEPNAATAQAYLAERAGQLVVAGATVFRRVPEPRLLVQVTDGDDKYLAAWNRPDYMRPPHEVQEMNPSLSITAVGEPTSSYDAPSRAFDYELRPLTDIGPIVEQLTSEMRSLEGSRNVQRDIDKLVRSAGELGVTVYKHLVFTPAPAFPSRLVRISRLRAGAILDSLCASYGGAAHYMSRYDREEPIPGEVITALLAEQKELADKLEALDEPLFLPAERAIKLR